MKNFNELFENAAKVADKRNKVFNQLIDKTRNELLPKFCEVCSNLDMKYVFFSTFTQITEDQDEQYDYYEGYTKYYLAIDVVNMKIGDCKYDHQTGYYIPDGWNLTKINDAIFTKKGIVELVRDLNNRLDNYIKKYNKLNEEAEKM